MKSAKRKPPKQVTDDELREVVNRVASTQDGLTLLRWIFQYTGVFSEMHYNMQTGEVNTQATLYEVARKSIYTRLRKQILPKNILKIEFQS